MVAPSRRTQVQVVLQKTCGEAQHVLKFKLPCCLKNLFYLYQFALYFPSRLLYIRFLPYTLFFFLLAKEKNTRDSHRLAIWIFYWSCCHPRRFHLQSIPTSHQFAKFLPQDISIKSLRHIQSFKHTHTPIYVACTPILISISVLPAFFCEKMPWKDLRVKTKEDLFISLWEESIRSGKREHRRFRCLSLRDYLSFTISRSLFSPFVRSSCFSWFVFFLPCPAVSSCIFISCQTIMGYGIDGKRKRYYSESVAP